MSWIGHIQSRYNQSDVIVQDRLITVEGCKVDLRSFPEPNVVLCVDRLIEEDLFVKDFAYEGSGTDPYEHCDLIVMTGYRDEVEVYFIEAKRIGASHRQERIQKAIDQLECSKHIFDAVLDDCSIDLDVKSATGITVTTLIRKSAATYSKSNRVTVKTGMALQHVLSCHDVWNAI